MNVRQLRILDFTGDSLMEYTDTPVDGLMSIAEAERAFNTAREHGFLAYTMKDKTNGEVLRTFDPDAREIIMHRPMQGG